MYSGPDREGARQWAEEIVVVRSGWRRVLDIRLAEMPVPGEMPEDYINANPEAKDAPTTAWLVIAETPDPYNPFEEGGIN